MPQTLNFLRPIGVAALAAALAMPAAAERADRTKQMVIESDKPGSLDLQRQVMVFNGNVSITQGTLSIRADRVEVREASDGYRSAVAIGSVAVPAHYRQKRDGVNETVEGVAERIEYDGRSDLLRFIGNGAVRRLRGAVLADEITGSLITWDANAELFNVAGGAPSAGNPSGRVRAVLSPRDADVAASAAATDAASAAASAPPLRASRSLGERR